MSGETEDFALAESEIDSEALFEEFEANFTQTESGYTIRLDSIAASGEMEQVEYEVSLSDIEYSIDRGAYYDDESQAVAFEESDADIEVLWTSPVTSSIYLDPYEDSQIRRLAGALGADSAINRLLVEHPASREIVLQARAETIKTNFLLPTERARRTTPANSEEYGPLAFKSAHLQYQLIGLYEQLNVPDPENLVFEALDDTEMVEIGRIAGYPLVEYEDAVVLLLSLERHHSTMDGAAHTSRSELLTPAELHGAKLRLRRLNRQDVFSHEAVSWSSQNVEGLGQSFHSKSEYWGVKLADREDAVDIGELEEAAENLVHSLHLREQT